MPTVTLRDGTRMVYDEHDFTDPWRDSEPVVLVHGFSKNRRFWYPWVPALARRYRVIHPDLQGHGESARMRIKLRMGQERRGGVERYWGPSCADSCGSRARRDGVGSARERG